MASDAWQQKTRQILDALDLRAEYISLGFDVCGTTPSGTGWIPCRCYGREDNTPSASICVAGKHPRKGRYKEFTGEARNLSFFEAAAITGRWEDWKAARVYYAHQTGVRLPRGPHPKSPEDGLEFRDWNEALVRSWCHKKPPIAHWAVRVCGGRIAGWPKPKKANRPCLYTVIALPIFGEQGVNDAPQGWVVWNQTGRYLTLPQGAGQPPRRVEKGISIGGSKAGWMGAYGLSRLEAADVVWVCEGPTDMLALMSAIPPELLQTHVVITNSNGTMELPRAAYVAMLAGKRVFVVHDADTPGQDGGIRWARAIADVAVECRHVVLPYEIDPNHGKDVRDFFNEGHTYAELLALAEASELVDGGGGVPAPAGSCGSEAVDSAEASGAEGGGAPPGPDGSGLGDPLLGDRIILEALGLDVLGEHEDRRVEVFSEFMSKTDTIQSVSKVTFADLLQICGPVVRSKVHEANEEVPGMWHLRVVREAIAVTAGQRRLADNAARGRGAWLGDDDAIVLVGAGEAAVWNGHTSLHRVTRPRACGLLLDISSKEPWYDHDQLDSYLHQCDQEWAQGVVDELLDILGLWYWRQGPDVAGVVAGLVLATWLQTIWEWRPLVSLTGESMCGKSDLFEVLSGLFGKLGKLATKSSEPGIRQAIGNKAIAMFIDEFESDAHRKRILELLRTSGKGAVQLRGTTNQKGMVYGLRHIMWVAAVEVGLERDPDRNRFVPLELNMPPKEQHGNITLPAQHVLTELGQKLLAVALVYARQARDIADRLKHHHFPNIPARVVENYSVPVAYLAAISGLSEDAACNGFLSSVFERLHGTNTAQISDQHDLMQSILASTVNLGGGQQATVGMLLTQPEAYSDAWDALARVGIGPMLNRDGKRPPGTSWVPDVLFISHGSVKRNLLARTKWEDQSIDQILLRLSGAERRQRVLAGSKPWGITIPWGVIRSEFLGSDEPQDTDLF